MTLYELEYKLKLARDQGAEDNALVRFDVLVETYTEEKTIHHDDPLTDCTLERVGRQEIVLR